MNNIYYKEVQKWKERRVKKYYKLGGEAKKLWILPYSDVELPLLQLIGKEEENFTMAERLFLSATLSLGIDLLSSLSPISVHWSYASLFWVHSDLLLLTEIKSFYRQFLAGNVFYSEISASITALWSHINSNYHSCLLVSPPRVMTWFLAWKYYLLGEFPSPLASSFLIILRLDIVIA